MEFVNIVAAVFTALAGWTAFVSLVKATIGRRSEARRRLNRLSTLAQVSYFSSVLGDPMMKSVRDDGFVEYVFVHPLFYVHVLATSADESVQRYAVTTLSRRFHPSFTLWTGTDFATVRLGKSKFAEFGDCEPARSSFLGARRFGYAEAHYFGNPGLYQHYLLAYNDAGAASEVIAPPQGDDESEWTAYRVAASPNTYAVAAATLTDPFDGGGPLGVDLDQVRVLPKAESRPIAAWRRFRGRRKYKAMFRKNS
jgi:hypothetical protein